MDAGCVDLCLVAEFGSRWGPEYEEYLAVSESIAAALDPPGDLRSVKMEVWDRGLGNVLLGARMFESPARACALHGIAFECTSMEGPIV